MSKATVIRTIARDQVVAGTSGQIVDFRSATGPWETEPTQLQSQLQLAHRNIQAQGIGIVGSVLHALLNGEPLPDAFSGLSRARDQSGPQRIAVPDSMGIEMLRVDSILCAVAFSNYTVLHLHGGQRHVITRTLKDVEADLPRELFIRIHASHLVALSAITRYIRGNGGTVVLANGEQFPVSRAKKEELLERLGAH